MAFRRRACSGRLLLAGCCLLPSFSEGLWIDNFDVLMAPVQELINAHSHCGWANPADLSLIASTKSDFESQIEIRADSCGNRLLMMGGFLQCHSVDEHIYHEMMVHPALQTFASMAGRPPRSVFLGGSGDGAGPRELLRWQSLQKVTMVDIDYEVTRFALEWVPGFAGRSFEDPRLQLTTGDALAFLQQLPKDQTFDILILDFPDAFDSKELEKLYSTEFYELCRSHMHDQSILVTQSGPCAAGPMLKFLDLTKSMLVEPQWENSNSINPFLPCASVRVEALNHPQT